MSTTPDATLEVRGSTVYINLIPVLFAEWQGIRLMQLSTGQPLIYTYNGSNLYHAIRLVGGSPRLVQAIIDRVSIAVHPDPAEYPIIIDWVEDEIRCQKLFYYERSPKGALSDPIILSTLKIICKEKNDGNA